MNLNKGEGNKCSHICTLNALSKDLVLQLLKCKKYAKSSYNHFLSKI